MYNVRVDVPSVAMIDLPSQRQASTRTMIGRGQTCGVVSLLTKTWEEFVALWSCRLTPGLVLPIFEHKVQQWLLWKLNGAVNMLCHASDILYLSNSNIYLANTHSKELISISAWFKMDWEEVGWCHYSWSVSGIVVLIWTRWRCILHSVKRPVERIVNVRFNQDTPGSTDSFLSYQTKTRISNADDL